MFSHGHNRTVRNECVELGMPLDTIEHALTSITRRPITPTCEARPSPSFIMQAVERTGQVWNVVVLAHTAKADV